MTRDILVETESFPIAGSFTISRGFKSVAEVLTVTISALDRRGRGECVPYRRYGETMGSVTAQIETVRGELAAGIGREVLLDTMPAGAARNAVDCALWDLEAKMSGERVHQKICSAPPGALTTAFTLSLASPQAMAAEARAHADRPLLKLKVGGGAGDFERVRAVAAAAPRAAIILDANEGWPEADVEANLAEAAALGVRLVEQPLPVGADALLSRIARPVPVCADESLHGADDLDRLADLYEAVNIKLDKAGGLTAALHLRDLARSMGFKVMVGCMVGTSLSMAPAVLLAEDADFVDLDGPLLLARDRQPGLVYRGSLVSAPEPELWG